VTESDPSPETTKARELAEHSAVVVHETQHVRPARAYTWLDERTRLSRARSLLNHIFPDHWSFMLGELAMYSFVFLVITGVFLALYFDTSDHMVIYHGAYTPLDGQPVPLAYQSVLNISFSVRAGLLIRQAHHWAANIFIGAIVVHMARVFFTGAFRKPRDINWMVGATLLLLAIFNGYLGYSLPDDLVSGIGIRIAYSVVESIPVVGSYIATFLWGGNFPGTVITQRFFILHVFVLPLLIAALLGVHLMLIWTQEHTQFKTKGASEKTMTGTPLWPGFMAKSTGFMFLVFGVTTWLGAVVQIDPVWVYGPLVPYKATDAAQPDWYMGWLEGSLRLWPSWEVVFPGHMIPVIFFPTVLLPLLTWALFYAWPALERKFTNDYAPHNLLDHPRDRPFRTAFGVALFTFYFILLIAGGDDVLANFFNIQLNDFVYGMRIGVILVPIVAGVVAHRTCKELQRQRPRTKRPRYVVVERGATDFFVARDGASPPSSNGHYPIDVESVGERSAEIARTLQD
jgi:ubiquinol-cytochrome c reductase cytochrome b subunit